MKKLIFVSNYFGNGGAATVMKSIMERLQNQFDITLISFMDDDKKYEIPNRVNYICLNDKVGLSFKEKLRSIKKMRQIVKKEKNPVVISFEYFINIRTIIALIGLKKRLIVSERNDPAKVGNNRKHLRNFLYRFANVLVCQTEDAKNYFPKFIRKKTVVILNPLKDNLPNFCMENREKVIVNFCRLEKQKNLKMLISAFKRISEKYVDYKLYIYGDGTEKDCLIKYIKDNSLENKVFIFPFDNNIHQKIKNYSMYVSSSDYEGLSNSMLEAMAIGLPTICTDCPCGGAKMVIEDGVNGFLTKVGDVKMLSDKMDELLSDNQLQKKFSINAIKLKDSLSIDNIVNEWNKII